MARPRLEIDTYKLKNLIEKGYNQAQIAKELNLNIKTIARNLKENNLKTKCRYEDLVGKKFGKVTPIQRLENTKEGRRQYLCKCECGNKTIVKAKYLNNGDTRSCGCYKDFKNYKENNYKEALSKIGETHGYLTIIDVEMDTSRREYVMICKCKCGNITKNKYTKIKRGETISCGCYAKEESSKRMTGLCMYNLFKQARWYFIKNDKKIYCRSGYEVIYANYLIENNIEFEYEPKTFKLSNGRRYTPDFYLPNENRYIEIKGIDYSILDRGNQKGRFEEFGKNHNIDLYLWKDLQKICNTKYKHYSGFLHKAENLGIKAEDYLGNRIYQIG